MLVSEEFAQNLAHVLGDAGRAWIDGLPALLADCAREYRLTLIAIQCINMAWDAIDLIYRTAGTSASVKAGQPIGRYFRNIAAIRTHPIMQMVRVAMSAAKVEFGVE